MAKNPKFRMGDPVRAVRGPGGAMEAERRNIGKTGYVVGVHKFHGAAHHYTVSFDGVQDNADECCLERG